MGKKFGFSWSWKRAIGISGLKQKISKQTGIPLTKGGRQRKLGRMVGCCVLLILITSGVLIVSTSIIVLLI